MTTLINILAEGQSGGGWKMVVMMGIILVIMWVIMIRPQQKKQKELQKKVDSLKKGDSVVTIGGIHGTVNHINKEKNTLSLRVSEGAFMTFDRKAVATILSSTSETEEEGC